MLPAQETGLDLDINVSIFLKTQGIGHSARLSVPHWKPILLSLQAWRNWYEMFSILFFS
jgi:hypothetical protein